VAAWTADHLLRPDIVRTKLFLQRPCAGAPPDFALAAAPGGGRHLAHSYGGGISRPPIGHETPRIDRVDRLKSEAHADGRIDHRRV
jgi:hypothetical protein